MLEANLNVVYMLKDVKEDTNMRRRENERCKYSDGTRKPEMP